MTIDIGTPSMRHTREIPGGYVARVALIVVDLADETFPPARGRSAVEVQAIERGWQVTGAGAPARYFDVDDTARVWDYVAILTRYHAEQARLGAEHDQARESFRAQMETFGYRDTPAERAEAAAANGRG